MAYLQMHQSQKKEIEELFREMEEYENEEMAIIQTDPAQNVLPSQGRDDGSRSRSLTPIANLQINAVPEDDPDDPDYIDLDTSVTFNLSKTSSRDYSRLHSEHFTSNMGCKATRKSWKC